MRIFIALVFVCVSAFAQKPELIGQRVLALVECPNDTSTCVMLTDGKNLYVVKGKPHYEEAVWIVDIKKFEAAKGEGDPKHFLKLIWKMEKKTT